MIAVLSGVAQEDLGPFPGDEHRRWATRLNFTPDFIATAEQITGQPIADLVAADPVTESQMEHDAMALGAAMARYGVDNLHGLAGAMSPTDEDSADLNAALQRAVTILIQDAGNDEQSPPPPNRSG